MFDPVLQAELDPLLETLQHSNPKEGSILLQIFRDLRLVKKWNKLHVQEFGGVHYIVGEHKEGDMLQVIAPMSTSSALSMNQLAHKYSCIPDPNSPPTDPVSISSFTFGIVDSDSTLVYYKIHFGLEPPKE
eukprot:Phypoly_transcript_24367.p1 GENE.Phypoly_transcript_24367~~Phypoly_transcript_24367.p1  ORF type:complete len:131 (+),score=20.78 Phypoly_transcript_24367:71-463(+)